MRKSFLAVLRLLASKNTNQTIDLIARSNLQIWVSLSALVDNECALQRAVAVRTT